MFVWKENLMSQNRKRQLFSIVHIYILDYKSHIRNICFEDFRAWPWNWSHSGVSSIRILDLHWHRRSQPSIFSGAMAMLVSGRPYLQPIRLDQGPAHWTFGWNCYVLVSKTYGYLGYEGCIKVRMRVDFNKTQGQLRPHHGPSGIVLSWVGAIIPLNIQ